jgi:hypothetical protein
MDLGQSKSAGAQLDSVTGELEQGSVEQNDEALLRLLARRQPDQVVIESAPLGEFRGRHIDFPDCATPCR